MELNEDYPAFAHRAVDTAVENIAQVIEALRAALKQAQKESITYPELFAQAAAALPVEPLLQPPQEPLRLPVTDSPKTLQAA